MSLLETYFKNNNIHHETYLDQKLNEIIYTQNIPRELTSCICCQKHSNSIMCYQNVECYCPCRHIRRFLERQITDLQS